jgi:hypothetical protein
MNTSDNTHPIDIVVQAELPDDTSSHGKTSAVAYVFSSEAQLLASTPLTEKGEARLKFMAAGIAAGLRVLVGPATTEKVPSFDELIRRGALEQHLRYNPRQPVLQARFKVFPSIWHCWWRSACFVKGHLIKRVQIGGTWENFPVCNATVEIYEVDPLFIIIPKLPELVIERLRDLIIKPRPFPEPVPEIGPGAPMRRMAQSDHRMDAEGARLLTQLGDATELRYLAQVGSRLQFQQALIKNPILIRPLLCYFYPRFVTKQRVGTAHTDECGHFSTLFFQGCLNHDTPDLYFKATQKLFGFFDVSIYAPTPIACHTWWDYQCGTEVTLYTNSPLAHTCTPCPPVVGPEGHGRWVAFLAIGGTPLSKVYGTSKELHDTRPPAEVAAKLGLTDAGQPWGSLLRPRLLFSNELEALGVRYYQVSWRRGTSGSFVALKDGIQHYYRHDVSTPTGNVPAWTPYTLGPAPVADGTGHFVPDLTQIPYASVAPEGVWDTPPSGGEIVEHLSSAKFPTAALAPGLVFHEDGSIVSGTSDESGRYQLKVDLFDAQGQPINIAALGIKYVVPDVPTLSGTIYTTDAAPLGLVFGNSMVINLHVDNNRCFASIGAPSIGATLADPCCGVLISQPADNVTMPYTAYHPHGFAQYSFSTVRGTQAVVSRSSSVDDPGTLVNEDTGGGTAVETVHALMTLNPAPGCSGVDCVVAGFSENLYVDSMATDGWGSELGYDASDVRAFVLSTVALPS